MLIPPIISMLFKKNTIDSWPLQINCFCSVSLTPPLSWSIASINQTKRVFASLNWKAVPGLDGKGLVTDEELSTNSFRESGYDWSVPSGRDKTTSDFSSSQIKAITTWLALTFPIFFSLMADTACVCVYQSGDGWATRPQIVPTSFMNVLHWLVGTLPLSPFVQFKKWVI